MKKSKQKKLSDKFQKIEKSILNNELENIVDVPLLSKEQRAQKRLDETKKQIRDILISLNKNSTSLISVEDCLELDSEQLQFEVSLIAELANVFHRNKSENILKDVSFNLNVNQLIESTIQIDLKNKNENIILAISELLKKFKEELKQRSAKYKVTLKESVTGSACKVFIEMKYDKDFKIEYLKNIIKEKKMKLKMSKTEEVLLRVDTKERKKKIIQSNKNREVRVSVSSSKKLDLDL